MKAATSRLDAVLRGVVSAYCLHAFNVALFVPVYSLFLLVEDDLHLECGLVAVLKAAGLRRGALRDAGVNQDEQSRFVMLHGVFHASV